MIFATLLVHNVSESQHGSWGYADGICNFLNSPPNDHGEDDGRSEAAHIK